MSLFSTKFLLIEKLQNNAQSQQAVLKQNY